ncbi:MAG: DciA family protein [Planctomycetota bacterium]
MIARSSSHEWRIDGIPGLSEPQPVSDFLRGILAQAGRSKNRNRFRAALDEILTAEQRDHCQVAGFRAGKLVLEVDSAPLFAEFSGFRREEFRKRLNELIPEQPIAQLTFRLGGTGHV